MRENPRLRHSALALDHPLDFTIQYPPRREYFQDHFRGQVDQKSIADKNRLALYLHVPFCAAKCYYCNFAVDTRANPDLFSRYVNALLTEIDGLNSLVSPSCTIQGIDIGGGTPTRLPIALLQRILQAIAPWCQRADAVRPLSIETTPAIAASEPEKLAALVEGGVQRISVGLQSTNNETLASLNRSAQQSLAENALRNLKAAGFERISADLIFGLPGQTSAQWQEDLARVTDFGPDAITTYDCLYRGKGRALTKLRTDTPDQSVYGQLYDQAFNFLSTAGYHAPYGSVNFSRHANETGTSSYFEGRLLDGLAYIGLGNYASSLCGNNWWFAPYRVNDWLAAVESGTRFPSGDSYVLADEEMMAKHILANLSFGVIDATRFKASFACELDDSFADSLSLAIERGWLIKTSTGYGIAPGNFCNMPQIRSLFYSQRAIDWLESQKQSPPNGAKLIQISPMKNEGL
jgi:oxygen-independent coproporphyrinogen III oxidase